MNTLVFDIETVPDVELGRRLYDLEGLDDAAVAKAMFAQQRARSGTEFLPHVQQRVIAIACVLRTPRAAAALEPGGSELQRVRAARALLRRH